MKWELKVYVAGRTNMLTEVREIQAVVRKQGGVITHDWTKIVDEVGGAARDDGVSATRQGEFARGDLRGVREANLVIMVAGPGLCGALVEVGAALGQDKPVLIYGEPERHSVFFHHPAVGKVSTHEQIEEYITLLNDNMRRMLAGQEYPSVPSL
jgi:hypothetical protein